MAGNTHKEHEVTEAVKLEVQVSNIIVFALEQHTPMLTLH
jgi:hypothetical protein